MSKFSDYIENMRQARKDDAKAFAEGDENLCMLCHAYGPDKRSFLINCGYDVKEAIPEALDLHLVEDLSGYYLRVCKCCRGYLLEGLKRVADHRRYMREKGGLSSDGEPDNFDEEAAIYVRINGANVCMTPDQFERYKAQKQAQEEGKTK